MRFTKETLRRVLRTFFQAFMGVIASDLTLVVSDIVIAPQTWWIILLANLLAPAIAAGIAAVMNLEEVEFYD